MSILNSISWGTYWDTSSVGGVLEYSIDDGTYGGDIFWDYEISAIKNALGTWSNVCDIVFSEVAPTNPGASFWEAITFIAVDGAAMGALIGDTTVLGFHDTPGSNGTLYDIGIIPEPGPLAGVYNYEGYGFTESGLQQGGFGFITLIHELGHGLGFAHPHDNGGTSSVMDGVGSAFGDYGDYDLNQGIYTIMSYNDGWGAEFPNHSELGYGYSSGPMALDIALAQELYGANTTYANGNSTYILPTANEAGTFWTCIWDTAGFDLISNENSDQSCTINLNEATLVGASAGGYVSWIEGIVGGFTIANGVVIEAAIGGDGNDKLTGNAISNKLIGNKGADQLYGLNGNDKLYGGNNNDKLYGGNNNDKLYGGSGNDKSYGQAGNDSLYMDAGNDTLDGGSGTDWLYVTGSKNSVVNLAKTTGQNTGYGTDIIKNIENASGGTGIDKFYGTTGNNTLKGNNGNDILQGKNGNDKLYGGNNNDKLYGGNNNDKLYGGNNNDKLYGGNGNDFLKGDAGRDILQGDAGKDTMFGGAGADTFVFKKTSDSSASGSKADIIKDFTQGLDKIDLHYIDASTKLSGNNAFTFDGTTSFGTSNQGDIYYKQFNNAGTSNDYTMVYIDTDNDSGTEMSIKLMGLHNITADDFIL